MKFLQLVPSPIRCVRFCNHPTAPKLAVSRTNGSIEVLYLLCNRNYYPKVARLLGVVYCRWIDVFYGHLDSRTFRFPCGVNFVARKEYCNCGI